MYSASWKYGFFSFGSIWQWLFWHSHDNNQLHNLYIYIYIIHMHMQYRNLDTFQNKTMPKHKKSIQSVTITSNRDFNVCQNTTCTLFLGTSSHSSMYIVPWLILLGEHYHTPETGRRGYYPLKIIITRITIQQWTVSTPLSSSSLLHIWDANRDRILM
jgi:hypothetical protein